MKNKLTNVSVFLLIAVIFMTGLSVFELTYNNRDVKEGKTIIKITSDDEISNLDDVNYVGDIDDDNYSN